MSEVPLQMPFEPSYSRQPILEIWVCRRWFCAASSSTWCSVQGLGDREQLEPSQGLSPESQGQNVASTVLCVPYSLDMHQVLAPLLAVSSR